jgi:hypothetical protein
MGANTTSFFWGRGIMGSTIFLIKKNTSLDFLLVSYFFFIHSNFAICFHGVGGDRGVLE